MIIIENINVLIKHDYHREYQRVGSCL